MAVEVVAGLLEGHELEDDFPDGEGVGVSEDARVSASFTFPRDVVPETGMGGIPVWECSDMLGAGVVEVYLFLVRAREGKVSL